MKAPTISQLEKELKTRSPKEILGICIRLAKHKKENKELLTYLLHGSVDETGYINDAKQNIDELFFEIRQKKHLYN